MKHPQNLGYYEETKSKNNRNGGRRRNPDKRARKHFKQNHRRKISQPKKGDDYQCKRSTQNRKRLDQKRKEAQHEIVNVLNEQNLERILKSPRGKDLVTKKTDFLIEMLQAERAWGDVLQTQTIGASPNYYA